MHSLPSPGIQTTPSKPPYTLRLIKNTCRALCFVLIRELSKCRTCLSLLLEEFIVLLQHWKLRLCREDFSKEYCSYLKWVLNQNVWNIAKGLWRIAEYFISLTYVGNYKNINTTEIVHNVVPTNLKYVKISSRHQRWWSLYSFWHMPFSSSLFHAGLRALDYRELPYILRHCRTQIRLLAFCYLIYFTELWLIS